jgi:hypothetical protein
MQTWLESGWNGAAAPKCGCRNTNARLPVTELPGTHHHDLTVIRSQRWSQQQRRHRWWAEFRTSTDTYAAGQAACKLPGSS